MVQYAIWRDIFCEREFCGNDRTPPGGIRRRRNEKTDFLEREWD